MKKHTVIRYNFNTIVTSIEALRKGQDGGIVVGNFNVLSLAYADYIVLIANKEEELKTMMKNYNISKIGGN